ncbi:hypothetical protein [Sphingomonas bacterium]|uniref:hypothetical protein n=1 Tax=Sphingomonas bacterium TaxID=1895847 RepID=UPI001576B74C|nr:hypothetical protein [Sphingomonas bacterium]
MRTFLLVAAMFALPLLVWLFMSLVAATARVWKGGVADAREFQRAGFRLLPFLRAGVRRQDSGSLVPTRAGVRAGVRRGRIFVAETRAVSKDVF